MSGVLRRGQGTRLHAWGVFFVRPRLLRSSLVLPTSRSHPDTHEPMALGIFHLHNLNFYMLRTLLYRTCASEGAAGTFSSRLYVRWSINNAGTWFNTRRTRFHTPRGGKTNAVCTAAKTHAELSLGSTCEVVRYIGKSSCSPIEALKSTWHAELNYRAVRFSCISFFLYMTRSIYLFVFFPLV